MVDILQWNIGNINMQLLKYRKTSQLDLKFLDVKFRSVQHQLQSQTSGFSKKIPSKIINKKSINHSIHKNNKLSKSFQISNDLTQDTTLLNNSIQKKFLYHQSSTEYIFQQINKTPDKSHEKSMINNELDKYNRQIRSLQKENEEIHKQIKRIYFSNQGSKQELTKNVKNMRVLQKNSDSDNPHKQQIDGNNEGFSNIKWTFLRPKILIKDSSKKDSKTTHLPALLQTKFENIYQNLYRQRKKRNKLLKRGQRLKKSQEQKIKKSNETFQQLKTKILNNNIDKNFQIFFSQHNIRIPEILKNIR